ncbi:MAG TPA: transcriptional regulator [Clostridia bacterium]|nr:transcriptional regulator [Clostridia bacterium]
MKHDALFRKLRLRQLDRALSAYAQLRKTARPRSGWLCAIREARGIPLRQIGATLSVTPQAVQSLQISEANESISLKRLREAAEAMDCELVYALLPRSGKLTDAAAEREQERASERVLAAEHTMVLEDQAAGDVQKRIEEEQGLT